MTAIESGGHGGLDPLAEFEHFHHLKKEQKEILATTSLFDTATLEKAAHKQALILFNTVTFPQNVKSAMGERRRDNEVFGTYEIRDGELYAEGYGTLATMLERSREYATKYNRPDVYNPQEAQALLEAQRILVSGEAPAVAYSMFHETGTRFIPILERKGTTVVVKSIDVGKVIGRDLLKSEAEDVLRLLEGRHAKNTRLIELSGYPLLVMKKALATEEIQHIAAARALISEMDAAYKYRSAIVNKKSAVGENRKTDLTENKLSQDSSVPPQHGRMNSYVPDRAAVKTERHIQTVNTEAFPQPLLARISSSILRRVKDSGRAFGFTQNKTIKADYGIGSGQLKNVWQRRDWFHKSFIKRTQRVLQQITEQAKMRAIFKPKNPHLFRDTGTKDKLRFGVRLQGIREAAPLSSLKRNYDRLAHRVTKNRLKETIRVARQRITQVFTDRRLTKTLFRKQVGNWLNKESKQGGDTKRQNPSIWATQINRLRNKSRLVIKHITGKRGMRALYRIEKQEQPPVKRTKTRWEKISAPVFIKQIPFKELTRHVKQPAFILNKLFRRKHNREKPLTKVPDKWQIFPVFRFWLLLKQWQKTIEKRGRPTKTFFLKKTAELFKKPGERRPTMIAHYKKNKNLFVLRSYQKETVSVSWVNRISQRCFWRWRLLSWYWLMKESKPLTMLCKKHPRINVRQIFDIGRWRKRLMDKWLKPDSLVKFERPFWIAKLGKTQKHIKKRIQGVIFLSHANAKQGSVIVT